MTIHHKKELVRAGGGAGASARLLASTHTNYNQSSPQAFTGTSTFIIATGMARPCLNKQMWEGPPKVK